jgi:hypothetical protein
MVMARAARDVSISGQYLVIEQQLSDLSVPLINGHEIGIT